jgi:hypothetical protein
MSSKAFLTRHPQDGGARIDAAGEEAQPDTMLSACAR